MFTLSFDHDYSISHIDKSLREGFSASKGDRLKLDAGDFGYYFASSYEKGTSNRGDANLMDPAGVQGAYERTKGMSHLIYMVWLVMRMITVKPY